MKDSSGIQKAKEILDSVKGTPLSLEQRCDKAVELTTLLLSEALHHQTPSEKKQQRFLSKIIKDPKGKAFIAALTDQCFRSKDSRRVADQLQFLLKTYGISKFAPLTTKIQLKLFQWLGKPLSGILVPLLRRVIRNETSSVIQSGESKQLLKHLKLRRQQGVRINLNWLGEAVLGEEEAEQRLNIYLEDLAQPEIEYVSAKISTLYSQINGFAREKTLEVLSHRLKLLYRQAKQNPVRHKDGRLVPKFVNLDMEEYRDLDLTISVFKSVLDDPEFFDFSAGIVLQSYLPDSFQWQQNLTRWAQERISKGGSPIKLRLVKGANLAMEQVDAALKNWPQAPYTDKIETDANFKRMLIYGSDPERAKAVHLGIGSHNLFDIAFALLLRSEQQIESYMGFEMLEGMADSLSRIIHKVSGDMLLYCPAAKEKDFQYAVAYLIRRLDENTAPQNFLHHAFHLVPGSKDWQEQVSLFNRSCRKINDLSLSPRRTQNRNDSIYLLEDYSPFENEPDTDGSLYDNVQWGQEIRHEWFHAKIPLIPLVFNGKEITENPVTVGYDPSQPRIPRYQYNTGVSGQINELLEASGEAQKKWSIVAVSDRSLLLANLAIILRKKRAELIGTMMLDAGKTLQEADTEVSEAIDFAEYYRRNIEAVHGLQDVRWQAKGVVLVAPPWNFPCSIPAGGLIAALAVGNSVIFKPAPEVVLCGWALAKCFWEAGFDKRLVQFFPCPDEPVGSLLVEDKRIATVVLTGSTLTAKLFLQKRPDLDLMAETGGKNAIIITCMADKDLAIKDVLQSAFGHSGQKCSACSLAILEAEVYEDPQFKNTLKKAAESLICGPAWDPSAKVVPLIKPPGKDLLRALTSLEEGEEWLLKPIQDVDNPQLWTPGIKWGVRAGSFTHQTELFGPILGVMRAENLHNGIEIANSTPYGLTAGLHSLDEREHALWSENIIAGNLYINRTLTGAIVQRQPFGGCKESCFGRGSKAGGPNYLMQFMVPEQIRQPAQQDNLNPLVHSLHVEVEKKGYSNKQLALWNASVENYAYFWNHYFSKTHDPACLQGQDNYLSYRPHQQMTLRVQSQDAELDVYRVVAAALTCGLCIEVSVEAEQAKNFVFVPGIVVIEETQGQLIQRIKEGKIRRLRLLDSASANILGVRKECFFQLHAAQVLSNGRIELLHYLREVSLSIDYHRYGYLGIREGEKRRLLPAKNKTINSSGKESELRCSSIFFCDQPIR